MNDSSATPREPTVGVARVRTIAVVGTVLAAAGFIYSAAPSHGLARPAFGNAMLLGGPAAAVFALLAARRRASEEARRAWFLLALGAAAALVGQFVWAIEELILRRAIPFPSVAFYLFLAFHLLFTGGALTALRPARIPALALEITLDALLVLLAVALLVHRFFLEPVLAAGWISREQANAMLAGQVAVAGSFFSSLYLLVWRDTRLPSRATLSLFIAAGVFLFGNLLVAIGADPDPARTGDPFDIVWFVGWATLAAAGREATSGVSPVATGEQRERVARAIRRIIVPAAAVFLAGAGIDATVRAYVSSESRALLGLMGIVLALRIGNALLAAERHANERRRVEVAAQEARLRALVSQLHPHFIFNMLNSLSVLLRRDPAAAENGLLGLGKLLRYTLEEGEAERVQLADEWKFSCSYLELERLRLGDRLEVRAQLDDDAAACLVPRFIVQPLVENAVRHAASARREGARIEVRAWIERTRLRITVSDDGPGIDPDCLSQSPGLGLRAVRAQLEAHYGHRAALDINTAPDAGFRVSVDLPAETQ